MSNKNAILFAVSFFGFSNLACARVDIEQSAIEKSATFHINASADAFNEGDFTKGCSQLELALTELNRIKNQAQIL